LGRAEGMPDDRSVSSFATTPALAVRRQSVCLPTKSWHNTCVVPIRILVQPNVREPSAESEWRIAARWRRIWSTGGADRGRSHREKSNRLVSVGRCGEGRGEPKGDPEKATPTKKPPEGGELKLMVDAVAKNSNRSLDTGRDPARRDVGTAAVSADRGKGEAPTGPRDDLSRDRRSAGCWPMDNREGDPLVTAMRDGV